MKRCSCICLEAHVLCYVGHVGYAGQVLYLAGGSRYSNVLSAVGLGCAFRGVGVILGSLQQI
jgi:hypothetical protein